MGGVWVLGMLDGGGDGRGMEESGGRGGRHRVMGREEEGGVAAAAGVRPVCPGKVGFSI